MSTFHAATPRLALVGRGARPGLWLRAGLRDHHDAAGLDRCVGVGPRAPVAAPSLLVMRDVGLAALALAAIEDDGDGLALELLLQVLVELDVVAGDDEEMTHRHHLLGGALEPEAHVELAQER